MGHTSDILCTVALDLGRYDPKLTLSVPRNHGAQRGCVCWVGGAHCCDQGHGMFFPVYLLQIKSSVGSCLQLTRTRRLQKRSGPASICVCIMTHGRGAGLTTHKFQCCLVASRSHFCFHPRNWNLEYAADGITSEHNTHYSYDQDPNPHSVI